MVPDSRRAKVKGQILLMHSCDASLAKTFFDFRDDTQALDRALDRGVLGQGLNGLDGALLLRGFDVCDSTACIR